MPVGEHAICTTELRISRHLLSRKAHYYFRTAIKGMYVEVSTWGGSGGDNYYWTKDAKGRVLWEGGTCCKYRARIKAIDRYFERWDAGLQFGKGDDIIEYFKQDYY